MQYLCSKSEAKTKMTQYKRISISEENYKFLKELSIYHKSPNKVLSFLRSILKKNNLKTEDFIPSLASLINKGDLSISIPDIIKKLSELDRRLTDIEELARKY